MDAITPRMINLLGIDFNNAGLEETAKKILARPPDAHFSYVVTPNADHIERLWRIPGLRLVYQNAALCLLDSQLIYNLAGWLRLARPLPVTGADLTAFLLPELAGLRVAVIGMQPASFNRLAALHPKIMLFHHNPPQGLLHNALAFAEAQKFACETRAAVTFLALGSPVQELLAHAIAAQRDAVGIGLCIGGALDFAAGTIPRAPLWMRRNGLEWFYRLIHDPLRLAKRYLLADPRVLLGLLLAASRRRAR
jgi:UDP-N-acetyl-D-mannosaminuronic acid transferase (WecB/TagA/CpsF family)